MVDASSLTAPEGEIELEFFPEEDESQVTLRLEAYITEGVAKAGALSGADQDAAVTAWAYYRAYRAIYTRLLAAPSSFALNDEGSASYSVQQMKMFGDLATEKLAEFAGLVPETSAVTSAPAVTGSTPLAFTW